MARGHYASQQEYVRQDQNAPRSKLSIKRGILTSFNSANYTANVLIMEATSAYLQGVPIAAHMDGTSAIINAQCAVLFFDEQNSNDAAIIAIYPDSTEGFPSPPPGRTTFVAGFEQISSQTINSGNTSTFTLTGSGGIPEGTLGVIYKAFFTSATVGAFIQLAPHGASDITAYASIGNIQVANAFVNGGGVLQLDSSGKIDIKANSGNCTVTLYTHGYIF
ncbi:MAG TPA: hypothetical protein VGL94_08445 [Ktedonobacteraceae bacterium]|jgi:hypothetical protein